MLAAAMIIVAAAMEDELDAGLRLCRSVDETEGALPRLRRAVRGDRTICFLRTGVGPEKAALRLREALNRLAGGSAEGVPELILTIGYAGGIDPDLRLGDLVAVRNAREFRLNKQRPSWDEVEAFPPVALVGHEHLAATAGAARLRAFSGDALTSPYVLGNPAHKRLLHERFHAAIVDMETAALARVAAERGIPISAVRVISDEASDTFLSPFSHDPDAGIGSRARQLFSAGMIDTYREWKMHAAVAKETLRRFLDCYL